MSPPRQTHFQSPLKQASQPRVSVLPGLWNFGSNKNTDRLCFQPKVKMKSPEHEEDKRSESSLWETPPVTVLLKEN